ncbi:MAG TPA: S8 family serine peptidase [Candidatus Acidoferrales bacterium]|nr:S8 family serine peptidase [Candidatus Acidoferrales bacterium]
MGRHNFLAAIILISAVALSPALSQGQTRLRPGDHVPGELLVVAQEGVSEQEALAEFQRYGARPLKKLARLRTHRVKLAPQFLDQAEASLRKNPKIKSVERNYLAEAARVPNDPGFSSQWHLQRIAAPAGWDITTGSPSVTIAVIDTGVDSTHPDLKDKLVPGYNFIQNNTDTDDAEGHGTAVAGAAAAMTDSGIGVAGVAWANTIMPLRVIDADGYATYADVIEAIIYAADRGAKVINLSLGGPSYSATLQNAVNYAWNKGAVIVAAAGNESASAPLYPAALNNVVAVSATDKDDNLAWFSNFGSWIDVAAPGTFIYTTRDGGGYSSWHGTSFSSPLVAGLAALVFSLNPSFSNAQVAEILRASADDLGGAGYDPSFGHGRINVARALETAASLAAISVAIVSPAAGSSVSGAVPVEVSASAEAGISRVELYVDGALSGTATAAPFSFLWNAAPLSGPHTLVAKAYDTAGGEGSSAPVSVNVAPAELPPVVQINGVVVSAKRVTVNVSASDPNGGKIKRLELYLDGVLKASANRSAKNFKLSVKNLPAGSAHTLTARAVDQNGSVGSSAPVDFVK